MCSLNEVLTYIERLFVYEFFIFFVLLQPEKRQKTAMYLYKSLIINCLINWGGVKTPFQTFVI